MHNLIAVRVHGDRALERINLMEKCSFWNSKKRRSKSWMDRIARFSHEILINSSSKFVRYCFPKNSPLASTKIISILCIYRTASIHLAASLMPLHSKGFFTSPSRPGQTLCSILILFQSRYAERLSNTSTIFLFSDHSKTPNHLVECLVSALVAEFLGLIGADLIARTTTLHVRLNASHALPWA